MFWSFTKVTEVQRTDVHCTFIDATELMGATNT